MNDENDEGPATVAQLGQIKKFGLKVPNPITKIEARTLLRDLYKDKSDIKGFRRLERKRVYLRPLLDRGVSPGWTYRSGRTLTVHWISLEDGRLTFYDPNDDTYHTVSAGGMQFIKPDGFNPPTEALPTIPEGYVPISKDVCKTVQAGSYGDAARGALQMIPAYPHGPKVPYMPESLLGKSKTLDPEQRMLRKEFLAGLAQRRHCTYCGTLKDAPAEMNRMSKRWWEQFRVCRKCEVLYETRSTPPPHYFCQRCGGAREDRQPRGLFCEACRALKARFMPTQSK